ncbi:MAG: IS256 family transposase [Alphaproteobacteria bacterium]|uniref:Mutator family transposase n=1 Tax=Candidatus Nitrobium versatile TaxID=2884831 RepID=A0A953J9S1_9BACT|nr:IS256 family transposase [Candidatus Nitrobium versatile]
MQKQKKAARPEDVKARIKQLVQQTMQEALEGELEDFLGYPKHGKAPADNSRNGYSDKTIQTDTGPIELRVPRDRDSEFEPRLVRKRQTVLDDLEDKVVAMYAKGMTTRDIQGILGDMYGTALSPSLISRITDRILPRLEEWQNRPLRNVYAMVWFDCIFYAVRDEGKVQQKAVYVVIGLRLDGRKELLGFWVDKTESKGFWLGVLNDLKGRGVRDVFIFSVDGLTGIQDAIRAAYPKADVQRCVVHQIRNSLRYVSWKDRKELAADLKTIYGAATLSEAGRQMDRFEERWLSQYHHVIKSWRGNWESLTTFFRYPVEIRKVMYTTNIIESVNSKFRKVTDARRVFPLDEAVLKSLYMAALELEKKWTKPIKDWPIIYSQLGILFEDRIPA